MKPEDKFETVLFLPAGDDRKGEGGLRTKRYCKRSYEGKFIGKCLDSIIAQDYPKDKLEV